MPSLQSLREFKTSFDEIGNEKAVLEAQNLSYEDLPLPDVEAEEPVDAELPADLSPFEDQAQDSAGDSPPPDPALGDFDLDALLEAVPPDLPDDSGIPGDLLEGFADDLEQTPADTGLSDPGDTGFDDAGADTGTLEGLEGLEGLEDLDLDLEPESPGLDLGTEGASLGLEDTGDFGDAGNLEVETGDGDF